MFPAPQLPATGISPRCSSSTCIYGIQYGDASFSIGFFAKEKLTLISKDVFNNFLFGCGQYNEGLFRGLSKSLKFTTLSTRTSFYGIDIIGISVVAKNYQSRHLTS
ncbi:hypothetical protein V6N13_045876 [Hibiscus sabdariffa]|uniref:Xylanase inhibitor N-terminal domain-containing protein n=2 Tax=Hibiscus sabdariffa TaxID=183260 RepID=A0ABR2BEJ3_9ROSI